MNEIYANVVYVDESDGNHEDPTAKVECQPGILTVYFLGEKSVFIRTNSFLLFELLSFCTFIFTGCYLVRESGIRRLSEKKLEIEPIGRFEFKMLIEVSDSPLMQSIEECLSKPPGH